MNVSVKCFHCGSSAGNVLRDFVISLGTNNPVSEEILVCVKVCVCRKEWLCRMFKQPCIKWPHTHVHVEKATFFFVSYGSCFTARCWRGQSPLTLMLFLTDLCSLCSITFTLRPLCFSNAPFTFTALKLWPLPLRRFYRNDKRHISLQILW